MRRLPSNLAQLRAAWRVTSDVPARSTPCFRVANADGDAPKLYVYDMIGGWDNDAAEFVQAVHALEADAWDLHINSPGGFVYDAMSMYEAVAGHPGAVRVQIDGLAASAASFLAMAGDSVEIVKGGRMMIHDAQGIVMGGPADFREGADLLDSISDDIAVYYADRAGGKPETWRAAMTATTWYSASEAVDAKLADRVMTGKTSKTSETSGGPDNRSRLIRARARVALGGV